MDSSSAVVCRGCIMPHKAICIKMEGRGVGSEDFGALIPRLMCTDRIAPDFFKKSCRHVSYSHITEEES